MLLVKWQQPPVTAAARSAGKSYLMRIRNEKHDLDTEKQKQRNGCDRKSPPLRDSRDILFCAILLIYFHLFFYYKRFICFFDSDYIQERKTTSTDRSFRNLQSRIKSHFQWGSREIHNLETWVLLGDLVNVFKSYWTGFCSDVRMLLCSLMIKVTNRKIFPSVKVSVWIALFSVLPRLWFTHRTCFWTGQDWFGTHWCKTCRRFEH